MFGTASDGSVDQWDGLRTPTGILLRWFLPEHVDFPDFGFDVHRARVPDLPPLPFDDRNVPLVEGRPSWTYAGTTLHCPGGLRFRPDRLPGWHRLLVTGGAPLTLEFAEPAWQVRVVTAEDTTGLTVTGHSGGRERLRQTCDFPGRTVEWRTRGLQRVTIEGEGSISFVGVHLLQDRASWQHVTHLCLPVVDPGYAGGPPPGLREEEIARQRLPAAVAAQWATRFAPQFGELLDTVRRVALHRPAAPLPAPAESDAPTVDADERAILELATLDPHIARIVGLAHDDPLGGRLDGREYVYKVTGAWRGPDVTYLAADGDVLARAAADGVLRAEETAPGKGVVLKFARPALDLGMTWTGGAGSTWAAVDTTGAVTTGTLGPEGRVDASRVTTLTLVWAAAPGVAERLALAPLITRFGLLPGIRAVEPGPPAGPAMMRARIDRRSPTVPVVAALDWDTPRAADGTLPDGAVVAYQVGRRLLHPDPGSPRPPEPTWTDRRDLVGDGRVIYPPAAEPDTGGEPDALYLAGLDTPLEPGWWGWWSRGVDLFGRVSPASPWALTAVTDDAPPPRPLLTEAEYVQADAPSATTGRSAEALGWLAGHPGTDGLLCRWSYPPGEAVPADVERFRVAVRFPAPGATGPAAYPAFPTGGPGGSAGTTRVLAEFGPVRIPVTGTVDATTADPVLPVRILRVTPLPPHPLTAPDTVDTSLVRVDMAADDADGVLAGGTLAVAGADLPIVSGSGGPELVLSVEHPTGASVPQGPAELSPPAGRIVGVRAALPTVGAPGLRAGAGTLRWTDSRGTPRHLAVLARDDDRFLCVAGETLPDPGAELAWYPDWFAALPGAQVGLDPADDGVARAQIAVRAVRTGGHESAPSAPGTVTSVDLRIPDPPTPVALPFDPGATCVTLASPATAFHGRSRFTLAWTAVPRCTVTVWRALSDEICRLDLAEHDRDGRPHSFPAARWPPGVHADEARRRRVERDLAAVDSARQTGPAARRDAVQAAYDALTIDTQMLLARQDYARDAFTPLTPAPLKETSYEDEFDGRGHAHWMYRLTSRTATGVESPPSETTPPVCAPDVVPPAPPLALMALADPAGRAVVVHWQASAEADLAHYDVLAARDRLAEPDLADATPARTVVPDPHRPGETLTCTVPLDPGAWWLWIRAVDTAGNRSTLSVALPGRALRPRPTAPTWIDAVRGTDSVTLRWRHETDARLACLVERRPPGDTALGWLAVSGWLPRGSYTFVDRPRAPDAAWEYRLRVRDQLGQTSVETPVISLPSDLGEPP
ncbi:MAG: hypothetical protein HOZ81_45410 [Streptomyces sp.]|nr:hypothetical protein [Streptomyces sp.]NUT25527.1 hypothetical protein [Streptomyces sp.]